MHVLISYLTALFSKRNVWYRNELKSLHFLQLNFSFQNAIPLTNATQNAGWIAVVSLAAAAFVTSMGVDALGRVPAGARDQTLVTFINVHALGPFNFEPIPTKACVTAQRILTSGVAFATIFHKTFVRIDASDSVPVKTRVTNTTGPCVPLFAMGIGSTERTATLGNRLDHDWGHGVRGRGRRLGTGR